MYQYFYSIKTFNINSVLKKWHKIIFKNFQISKSLTICEIVSFIHFHLVKVRFKNTYNKNYDQLFLSHTTVFKSVTIFVALCSKKLNCDRLLKCFITELTKIVYNVPSTFNYH